MAATYSSAIHASFVKIKAFSVLFKHMISISSGRWRNWQSSLWMISVFKLRSKYRISTVITIVFFFVSILSLFIELFKYYIEITCGVCYLCVLAFFRILFKLFSSLFIASSFFNRMCFPWIELYSPINASCKDEVNSVEVTSSGILRLSSH